MILPDNEASNRPVSNQKHHTSLKQRNIVMDDNDVGYRPVPDTPGKT